MNNCAYKNIFLAATPKSRECAHTALAQHYSITVTTSFSEICQLPLSGTDLLICTLDFDEGKMFDLLRQAKSDINTLSIPFICINATDALSPALLQSVETASRALGADAFIDMFKWRSTYGNERAYEHLRTTINYLLHADKTSKRRRQACLELL